MSTCVNCGAHATQKCGGVACSETPYCGSACQAQDWRTGHALICGRVTKKALKSLEDMADGYSTGRYAPKYIGKHLLSTLVNSALTVPQLEEKARMDGVFRSMYYNNELWDESYVSVFGNGTLDKWHAHLRVMPNRFACILALLYATRMHEEPVTLAVSVPGESTPVECSFAYDGFSMHLGVGDVERQARLQRFLREANVPGDVVLHEYNGVYTLTYSSWHYRFYFFYALILGGGTVTVMEHGDPE